MLVEHSRFVKYEANTSSEDLAAARHRLIERRAYHKWQTGGQQSNSAIRDWLEAEAEVDGEIRAKGFHFLYGSPMPCPAAPS
jgi:hypothetical protein